MNISRDYSYIKGFEIKLINAGYGKMTVHSLHFNQYVSDKQKEINRKFFEGMTETERNNYYKSEEFEEVQEVFYNSRNTYEKSLRDVLGIFIGKFDIHQVSAETSTNAHYSSDWDLFFWSNRGWNGKEYMNCFSLTFNDNRTAEQNMELLDKIVAILESTENEKVSCRIQYDAVIDEKTVAEAARKIFEGIAGKFISWSGYEGKIKVVNAEGSETEYGFFKKYSKKRYYKITNADLVAMSL